MPYASQRDRDPPILELTKTPWPVPPLNLFMQGVSPGVIDLMWTAPSDLALNGRFRICGVNIYRSFDSEYGPYDRLNEYPIGSNFYRDQTDNALVLDEEVTDEQWIMRGDVSASELQSPRYVFRTRYYPLVKEGSQNLTTTSPGDVEVRINGELARIARVFGEAGEIEIDPNSYPNVAFQSRDPGTVPAPGSAVTVTYRYNRTYLRTDLAQRIFYRVTTVGHLLAPDCGPSDPTELLETPLDQAVITSTSELEKLDYMWREAVRRNRWILDQGGERVKVFIQKKVGQQCPCAMQATYQQSTGDCPYCYGTTILGGYDGPYDLIIAPDDGERKIAQQATGRTVEHTYEVWTGPSPLLAQRDFIVKINGERYSVGPVRMPSNRGMVLQQHFNIGHIDQKDIRYQVPLDNPMRFLANQAQAHVPPQNSPAQVTDKPNIPDERELRGRTIAWENITY